MAMAMAMDIDSPQKIEEAPSKGGVCNWCRNTKNQWVLYKKFGDLLTHAIDAHLQDPSFQPTSTLCDKGDYSDKEMTEVKHKAVWLDPAVYHGGLQLQIEPVWVPGFSETDYPLLYDEKGQQVLGPRGDPLRDVPGLQRKFDLVEPSSLMIWQRLGYYKQVLARWPDANEESAIATIAKGLLAFRANFDLPLLDWPDNVGEIGKVTYGDLYKFDRLTPLQREHNTCGWPIGDHGLVLQPRPWKFVGKWDPPAEICLTNGFPHKAGAVIAHIKDGIRKATASPQDKANWWAKQQRDMMRIQAWKQQNMKMVPRNDSGLTGKNEQGQKIRSTSMESNSNGPVTLVTTPTKAQLTTFFSPLSVVTPQSSPTSFSSPIGRS